MIARLVSIAIAALGLAGCTPDITSEAGSSSSQPAATQQAVESPRPAVAQAAPDEVKGEGAAPAVEAKAEAGEKKAE